MNTFSPNTYYPGQKLTRSNEAGWSFEYRLVSIEGDVCTLELIGVFDRDGNRQFSVDNTYLQIPSEELSEFQRVSTSGGTKVLPERTSLIERIYNIMSGSPLPQ